MANTVDASFISQWNTEIQAAYQQKQSKLRNAVRAHYNVVGSTYNFQKMGAVVANTKARTADVTGLEPVHSIATATLADFYAPIYVDKLDELKTNASLRQEYVNNSVSAVNRKLDDIIIAASVAGSTTTTTTTGGMTLTKIIEALTYLNGSDIDGEEKFLVIGAKQLGDMLSETKLTSSDYASMQAIMNGQISSALGFTWILSNRLPLATGVRTCLAFTKSAVGVAIGQDISTEMNYVATKVATLVNTMMSAGAVMVDNAGVIELPASES